MEWIVPIITGIISAVSAIVVASISQGNKKTGKDVKETVNKLAQAIEDISNKQKELQQAYADIKKDILTKTDIEEVINNSSTLELLKKGLLSETRHSLRNRFQHFAGNGFELDSHDEEEWDEDYATYKALGGNGSIEAANNIIKAKLLEKK